MYNDCYMSIFFITFDNTITPNKSKTSKKCETKNNTKQKRIKTKKRLAKKGQDTPIHNRSDIGTYTIINEEIHQ